MIDAIIGKDGKPTPHTVDAVAWAKDFSRTAAVNPGVPRNEACMATWFANAIMAGFDEGLKAGAGHPAIKAVVESALKVDSLLWKNMGVNADWPIRMTADNQQVADEVAQALGALRNALRPFRPAESESKTK